MPAGSNAATEPSTVQRFDGCGADFNGDGFVGGDDALMFGEFFLQGAPEADFEPDGSVDAADVVEYQQSGAP